MNDCGLCNFSRKYLDGDEDLNVVYESDNALAFHSKKPFAEVHIMIMTKKHITSIFELDVNDGELAKDIWKAIKIASDVVFALKGGCKLEMYTGKFPTFTASKHFHCHVIYDS